MGDVALALLGMVIVGFCGAVVVGFGLAFGVRLAGGLDISER